MLPEIGEHPFQAGGLHGDIVMLCVVDKGGHVSDELGQLSVPLGGEHLDSHIIVCIR